MPKEFYCGFEFTLEIEFLTVIEFYYHNVILWFVLCWWNSLALYNIIPVSWLWWDFNHAILINPFFPTYAFVIVYILSEICICVYDTIVYEILIWEYASWALVNQSIGFPGGPVSARTCVSIYI